MGTKQSPSRTVGRKFRKPDRTSRYSISSPAALTSTRVKLGLVMVAASRKRENST